MKGDNEVVTARRTFGFRQMASASAIMLLFGCARSNRVQSPPRVGSSPAETQRSRPPPAVSTRDPYVKVVAGFDFTCALRESGKVDCFGNNKYGQTSPPPARFLTIASAGVEPDVCGLLTSGELACWGHWSPQPLPQGKFIDVCLEYHDGCAIRAHDRHVVCWGNSWADAPPDLVAASLSCNEVSRCGLTSSGQLRCWSSWLDPPSQRHETFAAVAIGVQYACGIMSSDHSLLCWGNEGQEPQLSAIPPRRYRALSAGPFLFCAITEDHKLQCFGTPALGNAYTLNPRDILPPAEMAGMLVKDVSCGQDHACAVLMSGEIVCWGDRAFGMAPSRRNP
jgi:Regulator of Chromosome Condensation (RCC1) repeat protein